MSQRESFEARLSDCFTEDEMLLINGVGMIITSKGSKETIIGLTHLIDKGTDLNDHVNLCINSMASAIARHGDKDLLKQALEGVMECYAKHRGIS